MTSKKQTEKSKKQDPKKHEEKQPIEEVTHDTLNKAALLLLDQMPDYVRELCDAMVEQIGVDPWQYLGGLVFEAYNNGALAAYTLDPAWKDGFKPTETKCATCGKTFTPERLGQKFCCNPCGRGEKPTPDPKKETPEDDNERVSDLIAKLGAGKSTDSNDSASAGSGWTDADIED